MPGGNVFRALAILAAVIAIIFAVLFGASAHTATGGATPDWSDLAWSLGLGWASLGLFAASSYWGANVP